MKTPLAPCLDQSFLFTETQSPMDASLLSSLYCSRNFNLLGSLSLRFTLYELRITSVSFRAGYPAQSSQAWPFVNIGLMETMNGASIFNAK